MEKFMNNFVFLFKYNLFKIKMEKFMNNFVEYLNSQLSERGTCKYCHQDISDDCEVKGDLDDILLQPYTLDNLSSAYIFLISLSNKCEEKWTFVISSSKTSKTNKKYLEKIIINGDEYIFEFNSISLDKDDLYFYHKIKYERLCINIFQSYWNWYISGFLQKNIDKNTDKNTYNTNHITFNVIDVIKK